GAESVGAVVPGQLLLDGQQRLTSLFQAMGRDQPVRTVDDRGKDLRRWYYVDIRKAVNLAADRDDAIVSVPEHRVLTGEFPRKIYLDLRTTDDECRAAHFPLRHVFDSDKVTAWQRAFVKLDDANWDLWSQFKDRVLDHIKAFVIPMIRLNAS